MHTRAVLQKLFDESLPEVNGHRRRSLTVAVDSVARGASVSVTDMGRSLIASTRIKHRVKRMDRLVGNQILVAERAAYYQTIADRLLTGHPSPVVLIDWSDFSVDRQQQLLRASLPVGGRAITLYEELHPYELLANRSVQHRFLDQLARMMPAGCCPIIIADAGFKTPFFRYVEELAWHWIGRIRSRDYVQWDGSPHEWVSAKSLYKLATTRAQNLGTALWVRSAPLDCRLTLIRKRKAGRKDQTFSGAARRSKASQVHRKREREPWLLVASRSLDDRSAKQLVKLYRTRMQIEENFRDTKSSTHGLGIARYSRTSMARATNLLLIAALATFVLWIIGSMAREARLDRLVRVNSSSRTADHSCLRLARLVLRHGEGRIPISILDRGGTLAHQYLNAVQLP